MVEWNSVNSGTERSLLMQFSMKVGRIHSLDRTDL